MANPNYSFGASSAPTSFGTAAPTMDDLLQSIMGFGSRGNATAQNGVDPNLFTNSGSLGAGGNMGAPNTLGIGGTSSAPGAGAPVGMDGWGKAQVGIQAASALMNGILGYQQLGVAKDTLAFNKGVFNKNYANQVQTTNTQLEDRQIARVSGQGGAGAGAYASVEDYMAKNRVS